MYIYQGLTLKAFELASTATATGPTYATAAWRSDSLPLLMITLPDISAPTLFLLKAHEDCFTERERERKRERGDILTDNNSMHTQAKPNSPINFSLCYYNPLVPRTNPMSSHLYLVTS